MLRTVSTKRFGNAFLKRLARGVRAGEALDELRLTVGRAYSESGRSARTPEDYISRLCSVASLQRFAPILTAPICIPFIWLMEGSVRGPRVR